MTAWQQTPEGLRLSVRLQPGARSLGIEGVERLADGRAVLKVKVTAAPESGKANAALIALLAKEWKLRKSDLELIAGQKARNKTLLLRDCGTELQEMLAARYPSTG
ncbi:DUF167 domain-containing protein [Aquibaculum arenosum]|uniref:UPF0235 protein P2G67_10470 n=1 Tax=Aquibaculum arenosum TaxID=3032591 RepID=A0ABT5YQD3_9PROT|nr:DUF167 family protein [Fodinicurvata sp. CAU 1616]MDF2096399.1 DUF167 family protein [Fodinicurvata sp. CAU 1616]